MLQSKKNATKVSTSSYAGGRQPIYKVKMSRKLNAVIPDETWEALDKIAAREKRTRSYMAATLIGEAVEEYWRRNPPEPEPEPPTAKPAAKTATKQRRPSASKK